MSPEAVDLSKVGEWDWDKLMCEIGKMMRGMQEEGTIPAPPHDEWIMFTCHYLIKEGGEIYIDGLSASPSGIVGNSEEVTDGDADED